MVGGQGFAVHAQDEQHARPGQLLQGKALVIGIGGLEINVFRFGPGLNAPEDLFDAEPFPRRLGGPALHTLEARHLGDSLVITSYSIHYTKLYDPHGPLHRSGGMNPAGLRARPFLQDNPMRKFTTILSFGLSSLFVLFVAWGTAQSYNFV